MANSATVIAVDGATIPITGSFASQAVQGVERLLAMALANAQKNIILYDPKTGTIPTVPANQTGQYILVVADGVDAGSMDLPAGYGSVILGSGSHATVTGGGAETSIVSAGALSYTGSAGDVVAVGSGSIDDTAQAALIDLGSGTYSVTAGGNQQSITVENGATAAILASGDGDTIQLGEPNANAGAVAAAAQFATVGTNLHITGRGESVVVNSYNNIIGDSGAGASTIAGMSGSSTIFAAANDVYFGKSATTEFISSAGAQTVFGGIGNDTIFNTAGGSVVYVEGSGTNNIFVADHTSNSTIYGNGTGAVFGDAGQTTLVLGNGNDVFVGGNGGADTIYGGNVTPTVFGASNETLHIVGSHAAFEVALGSNSVFNAGQSDGGNNFFALSSTGNTTLTGALATAPDSFNLVSVAGGSAHTLTIQNWHAGDGLFLSGYGASDVRTADTATLGGASTFTLSDGTTVTFQGAHPTQSSGSAIF